MNLKDLLSISKEDLLKQVSSEQIFQNYFPYRINVNRKYLNPLRDDKREGCNFFLTEEGLKFFDHAKDKTYDCFQYIGELYGISYKEAIQKAATDLGIRKTKSNAFTKAVIPVVKKENLTKKNKIRDIKVKLEEISEEHLDYLSTFDYKFTKEDFFRFRTLPFELYKIEYEGDYYKLVTAKPLGFIYYLTPDKKQKQVYIPFNEPIFKFRQIIKDPIFGLEFLRKGEPVVITKSWKDFIVLQLAGINCCCCLSETYKLDPSMYLKLRSYGKLYTLFDNDDTGYKRSEVWQKEYKTIPLLLPDNINDSYDYYKLLGLEKLKKTVNDLLGTPF